MKSFRLISAVVAALLAIACTEEPYEAPVRPSQGGEEPGGEPSGPVTRTVSLEALLDTATPETRSNLDAEGVLTWTAKDSIGIWSDAGRWVRFALNSTDGSAKGMFVGKFGENEHAASVAFHPYDPDVTFADGTLRGTLPDHYDGPAGPLPMAAAVAGEDEAVTFTMLSGAVLIQIGDVPAGTAALVVTADSPIAGAWTADLSDGNLVLEDGGVSRVTLGVQPKEKTFVLPVPAGQVENLTYWLTDDSGAEIEETRQSFGPQPVGRGQLLVFSDGADVSLVDCFVTPLGSGRHRGTSWENAMSLEDLADLFTGQVEADVAARFDGCTFHFAGGTYAAAASLNFDFTNAPSAVSLTLRGGYDPASSGKDLTRRDAAAYPTVFNGADSPTGRFARFDLRSKVVLEDLTFEKYDQGVSLFYLWTGATAKDIDVTFRNCSFKDNATLTATNGMVYGGVFYHRAGKLTLVSCTFDGNTASRGGAISVLGVGQLYVTGTASAPTVFKNATADTGGALYIENTTSTVSITQARFEGNIATHGTNTWAAGGAVSIMRNSNSGAMAVDFEDCTFTQNAAQNSCGGAIGLYNAEQKTVSFTRCVFDGNQALSRGGAFFTDSGSNGKDAYRFKDCIFTANKVTGSASGQGYGGAVDVQNTFKGTAYLDGCTFTGNTAPGGGGAWANYNNGMVHSVLFNACKFNENTAGTGAYGNAIYTCSGYMGLHNCAFWDNFKAGQSTPRDIYTEPNASSKGYVVLSNTTMHQGGGNACLYVNTGTARTNVVNSVLATSGYPVSIKSGSYAVGSSADHLVSIGSSNAFHTLGTAGLLLPYAVWSAQITDGYKFTADLSTEGFSAMTTSPAAFIRALGADQDLAFDAWLAGIGAYSRDIDGALRSGTWSPGCLQAAGYNDTANVPKIADKVYAETKDWIE